ncbi:hypothetical protein FQN54_007656 [Arachnomyces sp. PD_36]|nr:hypothetical protein FQN54_007656 [Arachnomyces sp. PD_36]
MDDPFISNPPPLGGQSQRESHRYSSFDTQLFSLNASSPAQAKRALEAHLAETERRLQDASKLGTALVQQQKELSDKLKEVEGKEDDGEIGPELRRKLVDLEKEYNEIGRESARAFLGPKSRVGVPEESGHGSSVADGRAPASPAVFSSQANSSPSKVSVPSRKQRNQQSNRVHDIEFATEISTSLLAQVRQLQALLAEREESLKAVNLEKSRLELEAEGFAQRIRILDESEQRYKDENWSLETQTHELLAAAKEAAEKENRLNSSLNTVTAEKTRYQRELDELKQANGKLVEDYAAVQKSHDSEIHVLRRNLNSGDTERVTLQQKVEELTSQNQELAKAVATKFRNPESDIPRDVDPEYDGDVADQATPENSPPPSPSKATPRHGHLESETLKSSLHHAHRMIQNLKSNIHREKSEKIELKRMLQDARDELDQRRENSNAPASANKRQKTKPDVFKKPPRPEILGAGRKNVTEIVDEPDWEDQVGETSPSRSGPSRFTGQPSGSVADASDSYQTANETEEFETANERETATESEAFQTGAESMAGDSSDELTETESRTDRQTTVRGRGSRGKGLTNPGNRSSYLSTASTSADDEDYDLHTQTPTQAQPPRYRLKMNRGGRGRPFIDTSGGSRPSSAQNSPAALNSSHGSDVPAGQSLFAELGELNSPDSDAESATPSRSEAGFQVSTPTSLGRPFMADADIPDVVMVDSSMMTDPWEPSPKEVEQPAASTPVAAVALRSDQQTDQTLPTPEPDTLPEFVDSSTQYTPQKSMPSANNGPAEDFPTPPKTIWDESAPNSYVKESSKEVPSAEVEAPQPKELHVSEIFSEETKPVSAVLPEPQPRPAAEMIVSGISSESTEPQSSPPVVAPAQTFPQLAVSSVFTEETIPVKSDPVPVALTNNGAVYADASSGSDGSPQRPRTAVHATEATGNSVDAEPLPNIPAIFVAEDGTSQPSQPDDIIKEEQHDMPLSNISGNSTSRGLSDLKSVITSDQGAQTILSADQIDRILTERSAQSLSPSGNRFGRPHSESDPSSPSTTPRAKPVTRIHDSVTVRDPSQSATPTLRRPGSAGSQRYSSTSHPPLPTDHREAIAAASQRLSQETSGGLMGPPLRPASAYRTSVHSRPRTPNDMAPPPNPRSGATSRSKVRTSSQMSRSSMSSFASELEQRFNMQSDADPAVDSGADPRMIQAITQTMIGEFLWKYTRKTGRTDMSTTRHQRYFWVHPYTRTLYWSDQDPQGAGRTEVKAKSVPIEAVRVITDDNPYPPGLHRKSLEVVTPGRKLRFTAATSQRHETWFNALSYLLLRTSEEDADDQENITSEDIDDFNPSQRNAAVRMSLSSYHSRTTQNTSRHRASSGMSIRQSVTPSYAASTANNNRNSTLRPTQANQARQGSVSRLTNMFKNTSIRGSFSSRYSGHSQSESIYDASVVEQDSAEELRQVIERQEQEADRLENVRACCDGKHDVSSLSRTSRYGSKANRHSHSHH